MAAKASAPLLPCHLVETAPQPELTVLWFHGLGANCYDFADLPAALNLEFPTRFVFLQAPTRPITVNGGLKMPAWYDITKLDFERSVDAAGLEESIAQVGALIEREKALGRPPEQVMLGGFSQGGALASAVAFSQLLKQAKSAAPPFAYFGVVSLSAYCLHRADLADDSLTSEFNQTPFFLSHGRNDSVVPFSLGEQHKTLLRNKGYEVTWRETDLPHSVSGELLGQLSAWIKQRRERLKRQ